MTRLLGRGPGLLVTPAALGVALLFAAGCGRAPKLVPVEGKVYVNDKAVEGSDTVKGYVVFHPDQSKGNMTQDHVQSEIGPDGSFKAFAGPKEGVPPGWYKVTVELAKTNPKDPYDHKPLIDEKYREADKSGFAFEVVENPEPGRYDIRIKK